MTLKDEEATVQAFIKMWKDLTKTGDKLNAAQMDAAQKMMKHATDMISNTKTQKASITMSNKQLKFGEKELAVRERLKKADEHLVQLRHKLNIEQEREHGDQVRRNINLRKNMDSFNDKFDMLKKSLGGGFGFQAAMDKTVKNMGGMTRTFQENKIAGEKYKKAQEMSAEALFKMQMAFQTGDDADKQEAKTELMLMKKAELRTGIDVENTEEDMEKQGIAGRFKPIFAKLDQIGGFLGKKAVPIGIGMGVAGILMSVIVKAFSASPLFAQMMKLMKFMVTLILMPIGTFFGALLRPILIMLLRKFIVPFYATWMPKLMDWGNKFGNWIVALTPEAIGKAVGEWIRDPLNLNETEAEKAARLEAERLAALVNDPNSDPSKFNPKDGGTYDPYPGSSADNYDPNAGDADGKFQPKDGGTYDPYNPYGQDQSEQGFGQAAAEEVDFPDPNSDPNKFQPKDGGTYDPYDPYSKNSKENPLYVDAGWGDGEGLPEYVNPITPGEGEELSATQKDTNLMMSNPALWQQQINMKNQVETGGIIEDALAPIAQFVENPRFAGTPSEGKLSSIHNAGISEGAYEQANTPSGHSISDAGRALLEAAGMTGGIITAADGFNGMVNSPTMFMAGEAGAEHVTVTPSGGSNGSGGITVNIQNMNGSDNDLRKLKQTILEVIQQSSANRGRL